MKSPTNILLRFSWLLCFNFVFTNVYGQDSFDDFTYKSIQSPNAHSLGKFGDIPVSLYTGIPNISVPITSINVGSFTLPVSLDYHAGGIKAQEKASWVGLGWALNAGGVITRSVRGQNDLHKESGLNSGYFYNDAPLSEIWNNPLGSTAKDWYNHHLDRLPTQHATNDLEPDIFFYNFAGHSGKFVLPHGEGQNQDWSTIEINTVPYSNLKIEIAPYDTSYSDLNGDIKSFTITTSEGIKFIFDKIEVTRGYLQLSNGYGGSTVADIASWYLSTIILPNTDEFISMAYTDLPANLNTSGGNIQNQTINRTSSIVEPKWNNPEEDSLWNTSFGVIRSTQSVAYQFTRRLKSIENDNYKLVFVSNSTPDRLDAPRQDISSCFPCTLYKKEYKLNSIKLYKKSQSGESEIRRWNFNFDYFNNSISSELGYTESSSDPDLFKRLKLISVDVSDPLDNIIESYSFEYNENSFEYKAYDFEEDEFIDFGFTPYVTLPPYLDYVEEVDPALGKINMKHSPAYDHWGFFNGVFTNPIYNIPYFDYDFYSTPRYVNREVNEEAMKSGMLSKIVFPTGGYTTFEYEANRFDAFGEIEFEETFLAGGLRIKTIKNYDGVNSDPSEKQYFYTENYPNTANSSGSLVSPPLYKTPTLPGDIDIDIGTDVFSLTETSLVPLGTTLGGIVGYKEVTVTSDGYGYEKSLFTSPETYPDTAHKLFVWSDDTTSVLWKEMNHRYNYYQHSPYSPLYLTSSKMLWGMGYRSSMDFRRGRLKTRSVYNSDDELINKTINSYYDEQINVIKGVSVRNLEGHYTDGGPVSSWQLWDSFVIHYKHISSWNYLKEQKNFNYNPSTGDSLMTETHFEYSPNHLQLTKKIEINSNEDERVTEYKYAHEEYAPMESLNMFTQPYSITIKDGVADTVVSKNWTLWKDWGGGQWLPCGKWVWDGGSLTPSLTCNSN